MLSYARTLHDISFVGLQLPKQNDLLLSLAPPPNCYNWERFKLNHYKVNGMYSDPFQELKHK